MLAPKLGGDAPTCRQPGPSRWPAAEHRHGHQTARALKLRAEPCPTPVKRYSHTCIFLHRSLNPAHQSVTMRGAASVGHNKDTRVESCQNVTFCTTRACTTPSAGLHDGRRSKTSHQIQSAFSGRSSEHREVESAPSPPRAPPRPLGAASAGVPSSARYIHIHRAPIRLPCHRSGANRVPIGCQ
jgi:hypothetical protein